MRSFLVNPPVATVPVDAARLVGRIDLARGREELNLQQAPQALERLAARAKFESITASNAIEDVIVEHDRALDLIRALEGTSYQDRSEREFAGYRDVSEYLVAKDPERLTVPLLLHLHRLLMRHTDDPLAGRTKDNDNIIGHRHADGSVTKVFTPVCAAETEWHLSELVDRYEEAVAAQRVPATVLVALLILDFLAIHPFQDGNGRIARLLTTCELLRHGYGVARYASLEQRIYESKNSYYQALRESQVGWHDGDHDPWPWTTYLLRVAEDAYADFERRILAARDLAAGRTKVEQVSIYVLEQAPAEFRFADVAAALPDISQATIRKALNALAADRRVRPGRGRSARWTRLLPPE